MTEEAAALPKSEYLAINLGLGEAVLKARSVADRIAFLREWAERLGPEFAEAFDRLPVLADALEQAFIAESVGNHANEVGEKVHELLEERDALEKALRGLVRRKLVDPGAFAKLTKSTAHVEVASDVLLLVGIAKATRVNLGDAFTPAHLAELEVDAKELQRALEARETAEALGPESSVPAVYTLFVRNYDTVRQVVTFLRWKDGDADELAPSLWAGRTKAKNGETTPVTTTTTTPVTTTTTPVTTAPITTPTTGNRGMPGSDPFGS